MNNDKYLALNTARLSSVCAQSAVTNLRWKSLTAFALQISASYDDSLSQQLSTMSRTISNLVRWGVVFERGPRDNKLRAGNHFIVVITDLHHATCITQQQQQQQQCNYTPLSKWHMHKHYEHHSGTWIIYITMHHIFCHSSVMISIYKN